MSTGNGAGSGWRAVATAALVTLLAGCGQAPRPAPVIGASQPPSAITIAPGQTLSGIALANHVPMLELAELNHLSPPYKILAGGELLLPSTAAMPSAIGGTATVAGTAVPPAAAATASATTVYPTPAPPAAAATAPATTVYPTPAPPALPPQTVRTAGLTPPRPAVPSPAPAGTAQVEPPGPAAREGGAAGRQPAALPASAESAPPAAHGGMFVWPVRGRIIEQYGAGPQGTHNDGINIAAPDGSPVDAAGTGVVAYAGSQLRGYGNLILIKHPDGWISAYAHCQTILVKPGEKIARGQPIARVGATGNVTSPQLHFELRRGDRPVDPRTFLPPLPSASARPPGSG